MAAAPQNTQVDCRTTFVNESRHQNIKYHVEVGNLAASDTFEVVWEGAEEEGGLPPLNLEIYLHDGGFTASGGTYNVSNGDTIVLAFHDPDADDRCFQCEDDPNFVEVSHVLTGVTDTAATDIQVAASLNSDPEFRKYAHANVLTAGDVVIFPGGSNTIVKVGSGSTGSALADAFPTTPLDNSQRTFARQDLVAAAWTASYSAVTKTYTVTSVAGAEKVHAVVLFG